jgi:mannan endo-1,4-beta-mannosidase
MGSPLAGTNFWGWGGEGRAQHPDHQWRVGDKTYLGDPYSEPQGLNSVYNDDKSTLDIISKYAKELESLSSDPKKNKSK